MTLREELKTLLRDRQLWVRTGISTLPGGALTFLLKVQGNPEAFYVGGYASFFFFVILVSWHVISAKSKYAGVPTPDNEKPEEQEKEKYKILRPYAAGLSIVLLVLTSMLVFVYPFNGVATRFIYGTPTSTPTFTPISTSTPSPTTTATATYTSTPNPTSTPLAHGVYYMIVLDASQNMLETFDGRTKWDAAKEAVDAVLESRERDANYGLVVIGGSPLKDGQNPCDQPVEPVLPFSSRDAVLEHIDGLNPSGGGSIYTAFNLAKDQFEPGSLPDNTIHTLIFITGSSDACLIRDEWQDLKRAYDFSGGIGVELYSEIIVLEQDELKSRTIEQQIGRVSDDLNVQVPQNNTQLYQSITNVFNHVTNYITITSATKVSAVEATKTHAVTPQTPTYTPTPKPTKTPGNTLTVFPTFTPTSAPTKTFTPTATRTPTPIPVSPTATPCQSTRQKLNPGALTGSATIDSLTNCSTGYPSGEPVVVTGIYSGTSPGTVLWVFVYPPNGPYYPQSPDACAGSSSPPPSQSGGSWNVPIYLGNVGDPSKQFDVVVAIMDQTASDTIGQMLHDDCLNGLYDGITANQLSTMNVSEKASVTIQTK